MTQEPVAGIEEYQRALAEANAIREELDRELTRVRGFLRDLESASHHLAFHGDGTYTRGEACTISLEDEPSMAAAIAARRRWEEARMREREAYAALTASQRVALSAE